MLTMLKQDFKGDELTEEVFMHIMKGALATGIIDIFTAISYWTQGLSDSEILADLKVRGDKLKEQN